MAFFGGEVALSDRAGNHGFLSRLALPGAGPETGAEPFQGIQPVAVLGAGVGGRDDDSGWQMLQAHRGGGLVPVLTAGTGSLEKGKPAIGEQGIGSLEGRFYRWIQGFRARGLSSMGTNNTPG